MKLVVGTRGSFLARTQTDWVIARLRALHPQLSVETRIIVTSGDRFTEAPLTSVGGKGLFVLEIEEALLAGEIDLAVHSMKDLPGELAEGLCLAAVPRREDPRDAWISSDGRLWRELPAGAVVGTTSLRRSAQLRGLRPDLTIVPFRGNIDTRLRKVRDGVVAASLLAVAGLNRAGWASQITAVLEPSEMLPAAGQGALALETRATDDRVRALLQPMSDEATVREIRAERRLVARLGGNCNAPIGAFAQADRDEADRAQPSSAPLRLRLRAVVLSPNGTARLSAEHTDSAAEPEAVADAVFEQLRTAGAMELLATLDKPTSPIAD